MDQDVQAINQILGSQGDQTSSSASSDPDVRQIDQLLGSQVPSDQSIDPWKSFQSTAAKVILKRGLPDAVLPVLLGQAAVESARGSAAPGNNYFGIKGTGNAGNNNLATQEYRNGGYYGENSDFAAYNSPEDSVNAYLDLIQSYPGVSEAIKSGNPDTILRAIEANGYATSPTYVQTVERTPEFQGGQNGRN